MSAAPNGQLLHVKDTDKKIFIRHSRKHLQANFYFGYKITIFDKIQGVLLKFFTEFNVRNCFDNIIYTSNLTKLYFFDFVIGNRKLLL